MSRKKRKLEGFDVSEFLRESDDDLKSALNSLLLSPLPGRDQGPGEGLVVLPHPGSQPGLKRSMAATAESGVFGEEVSAPPAEEEGDGAPDPSLIPDLKLSDTNIPLERPVSGGGAQDASTKSLIPGINLIPGTVFNGFQEPILDQNDQYAETSVLPGLTLTQPLARVAGQKKRQFPIREMRLAQDAHTRAEQQVYEALWENARVYDQVSKTITIGFGAMARMVRLSESNARINVRNLIAKLAIEEIGNYNCEYAIGRSYRIFNYSEIQRRRRQAGLTWYMRRTLAVVFVDPVTKEPLDLGSKKRIQQGQVNTISGPNLGPLFREDEFSKKLLRESSSSSLLEALSAYAAVDDDVLAQLRAAVSKACADSTDEEIIHFVHAKGELLRKPENRIKNPMGFLLTAVPKCFEGESIRSFRLAARQRRESEDQYLERQCAELEAWRRQQQAILDDPNAAEEARYWARKWLLPSEDGS